MQNVWTIAWRPLVHCGRHGPAASSTTFARAFTLSARPLRQSISLTATKSCASRRVSPQIQRWASLSSKSRHSPPHPPRKQSGAEAAQAPAQSRAPSEFLPDGLQKEQVEDIFGYDSFPPPLATSLLRILQTRRINGTLDLDLHPKLLRRLESFPEAFDQGLEWLRREHPLDEDSAILRRIEREEQTKEARRTKNVDRYGPQSGKFAAQKGKDGNFYGVSQLEEIGKERKALLAAEEKMLDEYIGKQEKEHVSKVRALQALPDTVKGSNGMLQRIDESGKQIVLAEEWRPPKQMERWVLKHRLRSENLVDWETEVKKSKFRRLYPVWLFTGAVGGLCYLFAQLWEPPRRKQRSFPNIPLSEATIVGIVLANMTVFTLWFFPPAWSILNRLFISTPLKPSGFSMLGNVFSHKSPVHLLSNMALLWLLGSRLHEEIGRGDFLAIYLFAGVFGSAASLTTFLMRNVLVSSSLGASGSVMGIVGAYCALHPDDKLTVFFLPEDWQKIIAVKGSWLFAFLLGSEVFGLLWSRFKGVIITIDYVSHIGGALAGAAAGYLIRKRQQAEEKGLREKKQVTGLRWFEKMLGR